MENVVKKCCSKCKVEKPVNQFSKQKKKPDGLHIWCKDCCKEYKKIARSNPEYREKEAQYAKERNKLPEVNERRNERQRASYKKNPERYKEYARLNRIKHGNKYNKTRNEWYNNRMNTDPLFRAWENFGTLFRNTMDKNGKTLVEILGYGKEVFYEKVGEYIPNHHIDHKIPVAWFDGYYPELVFHYDNLHWLEAKINHAKKHHYSHPVKLEYFNMIKDYIKKEYQNRFLIKDDLVYDIEFKG